MNERPDYDVGDVVEVILAPSGRLPLYSVWRAIEVYPSDTRPGKWGVVLAGKPSGGARKGWYAEHFRKVRAADDEFTAQIRALKPIRKRQSA